MLKLLASQFLAPRLTLGAVLVLVATTVIAQPPEANSASGRSFENEIRPLFFQGFFARDQEAWAEAYEVIAAKLQKDPDNGEALAWKGSMFLSEAMWAAEEQRYEEAARFRKEGMETINRGVELDGATPRSIIPRGVTLLQIARAEDDRQEADRLARVALADLTMAMEWLSPYWDGMSEHAQGSLLVELADAEAMVGDPAKAKAYRQRVVDDLPGTRYALQAREALDALSTNVNEANTGPWRPDAIDWLKRTGHDTLVGLAQLADSATDATRKPIGDAIIVQPNLSENDKGILSAYVDLSVAWKLFEQRQFGKALPIWDGALKRFSSIPSKELSQPMQLLRVAVLTSSLEYERRPDLLAQMAKTALGDVDTLARQIEGDPVLLGELHASAWIASGAIKDDAGLQRHAKLVAPLLPEDHPARKLIP